VIDSWMARNNLPEEARPGAEIYNEAGCLQCHIYLGAGSSNLGAPELTDVGRGNQGVDYFQRYVANPRQFNNTVMPIYGETFSDEQLRQVAIFLDASKGPGGGGG